MTLSYEEFKHAVENIDAEVDALREDDRRRCPNCGVTTATSFRDETQPITIAMPVTSPHDPEDVVSHQATYPVGTCSACEFQWCDDRYEDVSNDTFAHHLVALALIKSTLQTSR